VSGHAEERRVPSALNATLYAMLVRPFMLRICLPVSVSQRTVGRIKASVATRFPSSLKLIKALPWTKDSAVRKFQWRQLAPRRRFPEFDRVTFRERNHDLAVN